MMHDCCRSSKGVWREAHESHAEGDSALRRQRGLGGLAVNLPCSFTNISQVVWRRNTAWQSVTPQFRGIMCFPLLAMGPYWCSAGTASSRRMDSSAWFRQYASVAGDSE